MAVRHRVWNRPYNSRVEWPQRWYHIEALSYIVYLPAARMRHAKSEAARCNDRRWVSLVEAANKASDLVRYPLSPDNWLASAHRHWFHTQLPVQRVFPRIGLRAAPILGEAHTG